MRRNVQNSCFGLFCWSGAALLRDAQWSFDHYFCLLQSWASHLWVLRRSQHSCILCCTADQLNQTIDFSTLSDIMKVVFFIIDTYMHNTYGSLLTYHVHVCYMLWTGMDRCGQVLISFHPNIFMTSSIFRTCQVAMMYSEACVVVQSRSISAGKISPLGILTKMRVRLRWFQDVSGSGWLLNVIYHNYSWLS